MIKDKHEHNDYFLFYTPRTKSTFLKRHIVILIEPITRPCLIMCHVSGKSVLEIDRLLKLVSPEHDTYCIIDNLSFFWLSFTIKKWYYSIYISVLCNSIKSLVFFPGISRNISVGEIVYCFKRLGLNYLKR